MNVEIQKLINSYPELQNQTEYDNCSNNCSDCGLRVICNADDILNTLLLAEILTELKSLHSDIIYNQKLIYDKMFHINQKIKE